jgi:hypothetical protein
MKPYLKATSMNLLHGMFSDKSRVLCGSDGMPTTTIEIESKCHLYQQVRRQEMVRYI